VKPFQAFKQDPSATAAFPAVRTPKSAAKRNDGGSRIKAVVIGGGTGAPVSIRALLSLGVETSAVVAMADDGGSTGILRQEADVTPPGDVRKCIAAMARDPEDPLVRAFKCRLEVARNHTLGNLMLAALEDAAGSFPQAVAICERLVDAQGHVYPSTLAHVTLVGYDCDGQMVRGQVNACYSQTTLRRVELEAEGPIRPYEPALEAIRNADLIVLGPGSLFTSVIPNLLVPGVVDAVRASKGSVLFVCSLADMQGETWGLTAHEHVDALVRHGMRGLLDYVLVHSEHPSEASGGAAAVDVEPVALPEVAALSDGAARWSRHADGRVPERALDRLAARIRPVSASRRDVAAIRSQGPMVIVRNLVDPQHPAWHHPQALCDSFEEVLRLCRLRQR